MQAHYGHTYRHTSPIACPTHSHSSAEDTVYQKNMWLYAKYGTPRTGIYVAAGQTGVHEHRSGSVLYDCIITGGQTSDATNKLYPPHKGILCRDAHMS